jgi:hypothetical protein
MKKILILLSIYSFFIILLAFFSLVQSIGSRIAVTPQMFAVNLLILTPVLAFSVLTFFYLRKNG